MTTWPASPKGQKGYHCTFVASTQPYITLRLVSSLNNPQNSEIKFCENMKLTC
jgi:hypothetical protein